MMDLRRAFGSRSDFSSTYLQKDRMSLHRTLAFCRILAALGLDHHITNKSQDHVTKIDMFDRVRERQPQHLNSRVSHIDCISISNLPTASHIMSTKGEPTARHRHVCSIPSIKSFATAH